MRVAETIMWLIVSPTNLTTNLNKHRGFVSQKGLRVKALTAKASCQRRRHIPHKFIFKNIYLSLSTSCREVTTHNTGAVAHERLVIEAMYFFRAPPKLAKTSAKPEPSGLPRSKNTQLFKIRICQSDNCGGSIYKLEVYSLFERPKISGMSEQ